MPLIFLGIDGFLLIIEEPAKKAWGLERFGLWGVHKWRKHCGGRWLRIKHGNLKGSEREHVESGRGNRDLGRVGPMDHLLLDHG